MSVSIASESVREELEKILASGPFSRSERLRRFLRYVVEVKLSGRLGLLRELPLGMDVFERGTDFDPRLDPIVRIDARRLRARLTGYYEGEGAFDEVEIVLDRGGYVPSFRLRETVRSDSNPGLRKRSVVVMPFESWSAAADSKHFGKVLTEEIVSALGQIPGCRIRVGSSEGAQWDAAEAPDTIVRGSIRRSGTSVRVAVNIVDGSGGSLLFSRCFDRREAEGCELQEDVIRYVVTRLGGGAGAQSGDSEALHLYLQGRYLMNQGTPEALQRAVGCFQKVVEREPQSSRAWAGMAAALNTMLLLGSADPALAVPQAQRAADKALEGEPHLPEVQTVCATVMVLAENDIANSRRRLESVIEAHPYFVPARLARAAHCLLPHGHVPEARREVEIAIAADPANPSALYVLSLVQCAEHRFGEARQTLEAILNISPDYPACWLQMAEVHRRTGNGQEALAAYQRYEQLSPAPLTARTEPLPAAVSPSPAVTSRCLVARAGGSTAGLS
jgi:serine/threonine-protein kinase